MSADGVLPAPEGETHGSVGRSDTAATFVSVLLACSRPDVSDCGPDGDKTIGRDYLQAYMLSLQAEPKLASFDAAAVARAVAAAAGDHLRVVVEYDDSEYNVLYAAERVVEQLGGPDELGALADELHSDYRLDFTQQELYDEVYGSIGAVQAFVVVLDRATVVRFVHENSALYVSVDPEASLDGVLDAVRTGVDVDE